MQKLTFTIPNSLIITSNRRTDTWRRQRTKALRQRAFLLARKERQ